MNKQIRKIKRTFRKLQRLEAHEAVRLGLMFTHAQIKMRPRARLFSKSIVLLVLAFMVLSPIATFLEQKRPEVVVNGHKILVAQAYDTKPAEAFDIGQNIPAVKSPFEFHKPVENGYISQGFRAYHPAIDIASPYGEPIRSMGEGTVEFAGMVYDGHGNMVVIDHGNDLKSTYAHMGKIYVGAGNKVDGKTIIGSVGLTGRTTGAHVHMEIVDNNTFVDPSGLLPDDIETHLVTNVH